MNAEYEDEAYEVARRLYGKALEPETARGLERSLEAWRELPSADRTFVLAHLGMLQLRSLERVAGALDELVEVMETGGTRASSEETPPLANETAALPVEDEVTEEVIVPVERSLQP